MSEPDVPEIPEEADKEKLKEILQKDEKAGRTLTGFWFFLTSAMGIFMVLFYMWCAATPVDTQYFLGFYVLLTYMLVFYYYGGTSKPRNTPGFYIDSALAFVTLVFAIYFTLHFLLGSKGAEEPFDSINPLYAIISLAVATSFFLPIANWGKGKPHTPIAMDIALSIVSFIVVGYFIVEYANINYRMGSETPLDTAISITGVLVSLEVARRILGWSMTIVGLVFLSYAFWGNLLHHIPILEAFAHTGFAYDRAINHIYFKQEGVFGIMATVLVTYVILFIFFGAFLKSSGASRFFLDLPMALAGRTVGGPAKVAVMASGFFGSVSGSAIANTVSTGAFTIPLMKRAGFRPHVAGAIEPSASIGGMFMPPIMGAGGFIMAEMTEIRYVDIMLMAIFPAVIYFLSVFVMIHYEAKRYGLVGLQDDDAPTAWQILKKEWFMSTPLLVIVVLMLMAYSPGMAAYWAIMACVVVAWLDADFYKGLQEGIRLMLPVILVVVLGKIAPTLAPVMLALIGVAALVVVGFLTKSCNVEEGRFDVKGFCITFIPSFFFVICSLDYNPEYEDVPKWLGMLQGATGTPAIGAFMAFIAYTIISWILRDQKMRYKEIMTPLQEGARNTLIIGATVGVIGIIVGTIQLTGIGLKFSQIIIDLSFGYLPLAILLIGLASLVLGMGVPVTAAYLITAVLAVGAVSNMISQSLWGIGFQELQAPLENLMPDDPDYAVVTAKVSWALLASHMLVYWFSQDSNITPPVCVAAYAGAAIAGSDPWKTGWTSFKFAKMLYIGPFLFAFTPGFLLGGPGHFVPWWQVGMDWFTIILATFAFGSLTMGYFMCGTTIFEWIIFAIATVILFFPKLPLWIVGIDSTVFMILVMEGVGIGLWSIVYLSQKIRIKKDPTLTLPIHERKKLAAAAF